MHLVITGPTGSGKTSFAEEIAGTLSLPLINADPFQFYRELPVLSNRSTALKQEALFFGDRSLSQPLNAGEFGRLVFPYLQRPSLLVGSGLYLGAALYGLDEVKREGTPFQKPSRVSYQAVILDPDRKKLYYILNERVDRMMAEGAMEEARRIKMLVDEGKISSSNPVLKAIGLNHLLANLNGDLTLNSAIDIWKRDTRRLAKRQWTWLRKFFAPSERHFWISPEDLKSEQILRNLNLESQRASA